MDFSKINFGNKELTMSVEDLASFLCLLPNGYECTPSQTQKNKETRSIKFGDEKHYQYNIFPEEGTVSLRYFLVGESNHWKKCRTYYKDGIMYDIFIYVSQLDPNQVMELVNKGQSYYDKNHPFRVFIKRCTVLNLGSPIYKSYVEKLKIKNPTDKHLTKEFFNNYKGYYKFNFINNSKYSLTFRDEQNRIRNIHSFIYINSAFEKIIERANCIELDCSFYTFRPYVYCIPQLIICNESVPIGLLIGPTEKADIFASLYDYIKDIKESCFLKLKEKPVLSDQGSALIAFSKSYDLEQFFCFRHLINKLGSSSELASIAATLLFSKSYEDFLHSWETNKKLILLDFLSCNEKRIKQFTNMFSCEYDNITKSITTPAEKDLKQSLWEREKKGIPTCSNHAEATHSVLNKLTKGMKNFPKRMKVVMDHIQSRIHNFSTRRNLKIKIASIKKNARKGEECNCRPNSYLDSIYGIHIPCVHQIDKFVIHDLEQIEVPDVCDIKFNEVLDENWSFPPENSLPEIETCGYEALLLTAYGKPSTRELEQIIYEISNFRKIKYKESKKFVVSAFITFSAQYYGYYSYESQTQSSFLLYLKKLLGTMDVEIGIDLKETNWKKNIMLLTEIVQNAEISSLEEYRINKEKSKVPVERKKKEELKRARKEEKKSKTEAERLRKLKIMLIERVNELSEKEPLEFLSSIITDVKNIEKEVKSK